jgi:hypothetical protein
MTLGNMRDRGLEQANPHAMSADAITGRGS